MATARELLEEADALMRRNRAQEAAATHADIPVLTEAVDGDDGALGEDSIADFAGMEDPTPIVVPAAFAQQPIIRDTTIGGDFPELTEIVVDLEPPTLHTDRDDASFTAYRVGEALDVPATPVRLPVEEAMPLPPVVAFKPAPSIAAAEARERDEARWERLAEDVRMQVLQRIDIFTDTGLQEQLKERLQPIVDRASADLVATINQQVGQLLRAYVAEAIEREIDKWRQGGSGS